MATVSESIPFKLGRRDLLSGTSRAHAIDRWIYVFMAAFFIVIVLTGFIPDSLGRVAAVQAGRRPPFPAVEHVHAVLMASFLLLLLAQTTLVATGRRAFHRQLGMLGMVLAPALVIAGAVLAYTNYHLVWGAAHAGPPAVRAALTRVPHILDNILLLQMRIGVLFAVLIPMALTARSRDAGFHKRMMILAVATALPAAFDRMEWLPNTMPGSPLALDLYTLLAVAPMFAWDVIRNRSVHRAYWVWLAVFGAVTLVMYAAWDKPWWHTLARQIMGV